jgi:hypothetical protein
MPIFNDLAIELQEAIWKLVLPTSNSRGVHWVEVEGVPHEPDFVRDSVCITQSYEFDSIPETNDEVWFRRQLRPDFNRRAEESEHESSPFFRHLLTTVPAVFGLNHSKDLQPHLAGEIAETYRCRQLSTYTQMTTLLSVCWLSRNVAKRYIHNNCKYSWPIHRSMGPLYRPRPMDVWETQYCGDKHPPVTTKNDWQLLVPQIHTLDLVMFRLHDIRGRATPLLRQAPWQYWIEQPMHGYTFACFDRIGIEWHASWGTRGGRYELRSENVHAFVRQMQNDHRSPTLYWLVDGVPRLNWDDYPAVVHDIWSARMAEDRDRTLQHLAEHWPGDHAAMVADHHLGQEFEANGRRYYIVFVVLCDYLEEGEQLKKAGLDYRGSFPGSESMWPEALREPVRLAGEVFVNGSKNLGAHPYSSYILSWEPIT